MAKRMIGICFLRGNPETDHGYDRGAGIRQIVKSVGNDGDGTAKEPCRQLGCEKKQIEKNADNAAEYAIFFPDIRITYSG